MLIALDKKTEYILKELQEAGFSAYVVGGSLRDLLLGRKTHDIDISTDAMPGQVKDIFKDYPVIETGIKHGTLTLIIENIPYEITTFRTEGLYSDNRRPDRVSFTASLEEDLKRRDFTINALAYSAKSGLVDLFGGQADLNRRIIRAVGDPVKRFSEDALRIMRALRFASVLGFNIEHDTKNAMTLYSHLLRRIAVERIFHELMNMLGGDFFDSVLREYFLIFSHIMPEMKLPKKDITPLDTPLFRLAALFGSGEDACIALRRLKADNYTVKKVLLLADSRPIPEGISNVKQLLCVSGKNALDIALFRELFHYEKGSYERVKKVCNSGECYSLSNLAVNGSDIAALGFSGVDVGRVLSKLLDNVINGDLENKKEALINAAKGIDNR